MPFYTGLARLARDAGLDVTEVAGWRTRGHGPMGAAQSVMWHHTGGAATGDLPSLRVLRDGRAGLPGPLCHYGLGRSGRVYVIAAGLAYHAGAVSHTRYSNSHSIGIEAENTGTGQAWPKVQLDAYHALTAALCAEFGWDPATAVIAHKEAARPAGRKIDPRGINMNTARATVAALMRSAPKPTERTWFDMATREDLRAEIERGNDQLLRFTNDKVTNGDKQLYTNWRHAAHYAQLAAQHALTAVGEVRGIVSALSDLTGGNVDVQKVFDAAHDGAVAGAIEALGGLDLGDDELDPPAA